MVEKIKHVRADLKLHSLRERKILGEAEIQIPHAWSAPFTRAGIARMNRSGYGQTGACPKDARALPTAEDFTHKRIPDTMQIRQPIDPVRVEIVCDVKGRGPSAGLKIVR